MQSIKAILEAVLMAAPELLLIIVVVVVGSAILKFPRAYLTRVRCRANLRKWLRKNGLEVVSQDRRFVFQGPFYGDPNGYAQCRLEVRNAEGAIRKGVATCGDHRKGFLGEHQLDVRWDAEPQPVWRPISMGRTVLLFLFLLALVAGLAAAFYRTFDCPDCPATTACLRCRNKHRITLLELKRRVPLDPDLRLLLQNSDRTAAPAGELARKHGKAERETLEISIETTLRVAVATLVEGPDGPLVLVVLTPRIWSTSDGTPTRVLLYDRRGRELDRFDVSMPGTYPSGFRMDADPNGGSFVLMPLPDGGLATATSVRVVRGDATRILARESWPQDWPTRGIARILSRDGSLEVVAR